MNNDAIEETEDAYEDKAIIRVLNYAGRPVGFLQRNLGNKTISLRLSVKVQELKK